MPEGRLVGAAAALAGVGIALTLGLHSARQAARPVGPGADAGGHAREADAAEGAHVFGRCAACHSIGRGGVDLDGPNLYGVVGSPIAGRRPRYAYSAALRHAGGVWTAARLDAWLTRPAAFAPGTTMTFAGLADPRDRADVIAYLATQGPGSAAP